MLSSIEILKSNREKKKDLVATSRAERGIARHVLVGQASCLSQLIDGLEARPTGIKGWKPVLPVCITLPSYPIRYKTFGNRYMPYQTSPYGTRPSARRANPAMT